MNTAPIEPMMITQRQPERPSGDRGTSSQANRATSGTVRKPIPCWKAKALPRADFGTSSEM